MTTRTCNRSETPDRPTLLRGVRGLAVLAAAGVILGGTHIRARADDGGTAAFDMSFKKVQRDQAAKDFEAALAGCRKAMSAREAAVQQRTRVVQQRDKLYLDRAQLVHELNQLIQEKNQALWELQNGEFCSKCNRTKSEIEKQDGKPFLEHVEDVRGTVVRAPPEVIQRKTEEYDRKIASKQAQIAAVDQQIAAAEAEMRQLDGVIATADAGFGRARSELHSAYQQWAALSHVMYGRWRELTLAARADLERHLQRIDPLRGLTVHDAQKIYGPLGDGPIEVSLKPVTAPITDVKNRLAVGLRDFDTWREQSVNQSRWYQKQAQQQCGASIGVMNLQPSSWFWNAAKVVNTASNLLGAFGSPYGIKICRKHIAFSLGVGKWASVKIGAELTSDQLFTIKQRVYGCLGASLELYRQSIRASWITRSLAWLRSHGAGVRGQGAAVLSGSVAGCADYVTRWTPSGVEYARGGSAEGSVDTPVGGYGGRVSVEDREVNVEKPKLDWAGCDDD